MQHQNSDNTSETSSPQSATHQTRNGLLLVVDGTESSKDAVGYTGRMLAGCDIDIHLLFIARRVPSPALALTYCDDLA